MDDRIGEHLLATGLITEGQLKSAHEYQNSIGGELGAILSKLGYVSEEQLMGAVAEQEGLKSVSLDELEVSGELMITLPRELMEKNEILPVKRTGNTLTLAIADPNNVSAVDEVRFLTGMDVEPVLMSKRDIQRAHNQFFHQQSTGRSGRLAAMGGHQDAHRLARELQDEGLHEKAPAKKAATLDAPPEVVIRALVDLLAERGVIELEDLRKRIE